MINNNEGLENSVELNNGNSKFIRATKVNSGRGGNLSKVEKQKLSKNNANINLRKQGKNSLKCLYFNARSIMNKIDELELYLTQEKPDLLGIT